MYRVPIEMVIRHASKTVGQFFADKVESERKNGKVAILVEDFTNSLYFMSCDIQGYPVCHYFKYMTFDSLSLQVLNNGEVPEMTTMAVKEVSIMIEKPMISQRFDWQDKPYVFLWFGRKVSSQDIPLEKLNVSELMKLAQKAINDREGLIIDEAIKNKIYK